MIARNAVIPDSMRLNWMDMCSQKNVSAADCSERRYKEN